MAEKLDRAALDRTVRAYYELLRDSGINIWRMYVYGSYAVGTESADSDIDVAVFFDSEDLDGFEEDARLMKLRRNIDLRIEPHAYARTDFDTSNPMVKELLEHGRRVA